MQWKRNWIVAAAVVGVLSGGLLVGVGMTRDGGLLSLVAKNSPAPSASPAPTGPSPQELAEQARMTKVRALDAALKSYAKTVPEFSVAVLDRRTGKTYSFRGTEKYETASVAKVQVLACLLLTAQDQKRDLSSSELSRAKVMIRVSDNEAATTLYADLGKARGVGACNRRLGLTQTLLNSHWGLTRTTVEDQVRLLSALVDPQGPLDEGSRKLAYQLMNTVESEQNWGASAVAESGEKFTVKNGWLSRSTEDGRWIINTVGRVTGADTDVSIAVLSHDNGTMPGGIKVVEKVAKLTRQYLKY